MKNDFVPTFPLTCPNRDFLVYKYCSMDILTLGLLKCTVEMNEVLL